MKRLLLAALLVSGCALDLEARVPPRSQALTRQEAIGIATREALEQGYPAGRVSRVERGDGFWSVRLQLAPSRGFIQVRVDAWDGAVLRFADSEHDDDEDHGRRDEDDD